MRIVVATAAAALVSMLAAASAAAGWSAPQSLRHAEPGDLAINAHGDAVVAWSKDRRDPRGRPIRAAVYIAVRTAGGTTRIRRVWSRAGVGVGGVSAAVDRRGEITVAWIATTRRQSIAVGGAGSVLAAYGPLIGRWASPRIVGEGRESPRLAAAPNGDVLLVWVDGNRRLRVHEQHRIGVAWRTHGHRFHLGRELSSPPLVITDYSRDEAVPVFDAGGSAYVTNPCAGAVRVTPAHSHHFGPPITLGPRFALGFSLSVTDAGRGLASWTAGRCSGDAAAGDTPGPVFASVLRDGRFGAPLALPSTRDATATLALSAPGDDGVVSWSESGIERSGVFSVPVGEGGPDSPAVPVADGVVPVAVDGGGDQVLANTFLGTGGARPVVRPAGAGPDQASPAPRGGSVAVSAPVGRRVAVMWPTAASTIALSIWRP